MTTQTDNPVYNKQYFINKFSAIPDEQWFVGDFTNDSGNRTEKATAYCALGHCGEGYDQVYGYCHQTKESNALNALLDGMTPDINDGTDQRYRQETPKERILAALNDLP